MVRRSSCGLIRARKGIRVETVGQWNKGIIVVDRRARKKRGETERGGGWLSKSRGTGCVWRGTQRRTHIDKLCG